MAGGSEEMVSMNLSRQIHRRLWRILKTEEEEIESDPTRPRDHRDELVGQHPFCEAVMVATVSMLDQSVSVQRLSTVRPRHGSSERGQTISTDIDDELESMW
jgi:hypothetical protein